MMTSPRLTDRVSRIWGDPRAIVSSTAASVRPIPARLIVESRSRSQRDAASATTTGDAAPRMPALAGLVKRRPTYQSAELPTNPVTASTITAVRSRGASGGSGPSSTRETSRSSGAAMMARAADMVSGPSSCRPSLARGKFPDHRSATPSSTA